MAQKIEVRALQRMMENQDPLLLVHTGALIECQDARIPGSLCLPCGDMGVLLSVVLPKSRDLKVVFYSTGAFSGTGCPVAEALIGQGYAKIYILKGGVTAWRRAGHPTEVLQRIPRQASHAVKARDLETWRTKFPKHLIIDIRPASAYRTGTVAGAVNLSLEEIHRRYTDIPMDRAILVVDEDGSLAFLASSYLVRKGFRDVKRLEGGMVSWRALKKSEGY